MNEKRDKIRVAAADKIRRKRIEANQWKKPSKRKKQIYKDSKPIKKEGSFKNDNAFTLHGGLFASATAYQISKGLTEDPKKQLLYTLAGLLAGAGSGALVDHWRSR